MYTKQLFLSSLVCLCGFSSCFAQTLSSALPLLQKRTRTVAEDQQVLQLFRTSKDPNTVFAAGASLVKIPPQKTQEPALLNLIMRANDPLKSTFAAVIITAMGSKYEELLPILDSALTGKDSVLVSYAACAKAIIDPTEKSHTNEVVRLYIFDDSFANRALHLLAPTPQELFKLIKKASSAEDTQTRAAAAVWLGAQHTPQANEQLLKMAKTEQDSAVQTPLATALAHNQAEVLQETLKGLKKNYQNPVSTTYALALGFMTGNSASSLRQTLVSKNQNERINTLRALAYMAGVLSNPDAFNYTSDRAFDIGLLKSFIPQLTLLSKTGNETEKMYADNVLLQLEKLL